MRFFASSARAAACIEDVEELCGSAVCCWRGGQWAASCCGVAWGCIGLVQAVSTRLTPAQLVSNTWGDRSDRRLPVLAVAAMLAHMACVQEDPQASVGVVRVRGGEGSARCVGAGGKASRGAQPCGGRVVAAHTQRETCTPTCDATCACSRSASIFLAPCAQGVGPLHAHAAGQLPSFARLVRKVLARLRCVSCLSCMVRSGACCWGCAWLYVVTFWVNAKAPPAPQLSASICSCASSALRSWQCRRLQTTMQTMVGMGPGVPCAVRVCQFIDALHTGVLDERAGTLWLFRHGRRTQRAHTPPT
eukprot:354548-Chlamydomonas_euryale.AAC.10